MKHFPLCCYQCAAGNHSRCSGRISYRNAGGRIKPVSSRCQCKARKHPPTAWEETNSRTSKQERQ